MRDSTTPSQFRFLIVNADDFGISPGINRGIIQCYEQGIVSSASLMVRYPAAAEAAEYARQHRELGMGLHIDLAEWTCEAGAWTTRYEVVSLNNVEQVRAEVRRQFNRFTDLAGFDPDHVDSHQHVHRQEPVLSAVKAEADARGIPLRHYSSIRYCGDFYGQDEGGEPCLHCVSAESLISIIGALPDGLNELCCHPGLDDDLDTMYLKEREEELSALCHPSVREQIFQRHIRLGTFAQAMARGT